MYTQKRKTIIGNNNKFLQLHFFHTEQRLTMDVHREYISIPSNTACNEERNAFFPYS